MILGNSWREFDSSGEQTWTRGVAVDVRVGSVVGERLGLGLGGIAVEVAIEVALGLAFLVGLGVVWLMDSKTGVVLGELVRSGASPPVVPTQLPGNEPSPPGAGSPRQALKMSTSSNTRGKICARSDMI